MSKITSLTLAASLAIATPAFADGHYHGGHHDGNGNWIGPFLGGVIAGGILGGAYPYAPYYAAPQPYFTPSPYQPSYHWDCYPYGVYSQCAWVWR